MLVPHLTRRSPHSFDCSDIPSLETWLARQGFDRITQRSITEYARLRDASGGLVVLYHSGAVVVAGQDQATVLQLLGELAESAVLL